MPISVYDLTVPAMLRSFDVLTTYIDKADAFVREHGKEQSSLMEARLAPDMMSFVEQIQRASDKAKNGVARLIGSEAPRFSDHEKSFDAIRDRVSKTVAYLKSVDPKAFDGSETRVIELKFGGLTGKFTGAAYVTSILLPDFFFHISTAHAILRHEGVSVGKRDYLGNLG